MASGDFLFSVKARAANPPATVYAQHDIIVGTSAPVEGVPVLAFDSASTEYADFRLTMPAHYDGGGLTIALRTGAATTTGGITWEAAFRRIGDDDEDLDTTAHTYDFNSLDVVAMPSAVGELTYDDLAFTNGADMDSVVAGDEFVLRIRRKHDDSNDTAAADGFFHSIYCTEV